uniref:ATP synthase F0 subunit 8 n=1 Tax=Eurytoma acutibialis TaxID=3102739 RepID=UPI002E7A580C|nr:ATP synthase F0 subunit 8 [Eurytoma acutibialis]WPS67067.1 ATP synthase F0 subunit 8 [Eurytoma acutibialis]
MIYKIPQMSPLNWLFLYIYMLMILLLINIILNYLFLINEKNKVELKFMKKNNYKWMW